MKYSVVIPYYENEVGLMRALDSIKLQTKLDLIGEVIIVDDFSRKKPIDITLLAKINTLFSNTPLKIKSLYHSVNKGPGSARNLGIQSSSYKIVCLLDADEIWDKLKIEQVDNLVKQLNEDFSIIGHNRKMIKSFENIEFNNIRKSQIVRVTPFKILLKNYIPTSSMVINKSKMEDFFPENERYSEDYAFLLKSIFTLKNKCYLILNDLVYTDKHFYAESGLGSNLIKMQIGEVRNYIEVMKNENMLVKFQVFPFLILSNIKFLRRLIISGYYNKRKKRYIN